MLCNGDFMERCNFVLNDLQFHSNFGIALYDGKLNMFKYFLGLVRCILIYEVCKIIIKFFWTNNNICLVHDAARLRKRFVNFSKMGFYILLQFSEKMSNVQTKMQFLRSILLSNRKILKTKFDVRVAYSAPKSLLTATTT